MTEKIPYIAYLTDPTRLVYMSTQIAGGLTAVLGGAIQNPGCTLIGAGIFLASTIGIYKSDKITERLINDMDQAEKRSKISSRLEKINS